MEKMNMKYLAIRFEVGRHHDGEIGGLNPRLATKHRYEDETFIPSIQNYCKRWNATELVIRMDLSDQRVENKSHAFYLKTKIFDIIHTLDFEKVVLFDNDIQVVNFQYNLWELPTLSGMRVAHMEHVFEKDIGLNFGLVVLDKETVVEFAKLGDIPDDHERLRIKHKIAKDGFALLSHIYRTGRQPNFMGNGLVSTYDLVPKRNGKGFFDGPCFQHWIGIDWV